ncbi:dihydropteroate synthase [Acinetobacter indicus]
MEAGIWRQTQPIAQARKLTAEGADVIDLGPHSAIPTPRLFRPTQKSARIAPVLARAQGRWHSRLARQLSTRDASLCLVGVVWPISMIFAVFQTSGALIRNWR